MCIGNIITSSLIVIAGLFLLFFIVKVFLPYKKNPDTGLRGRYNGELYIDREVFYSRPKVRDTINSLKNSKSLQRHIKKTLIKCLNQQQNNGTNS